MAIIRKIRARKGNISPEWEPRNAETIEQELDRIYQELRGIGGTESLPDAVLNGLLYGDADDGEWVVLDPPTALRYLSFDGTDTIEWEQILLSGAGVTGVLPVANGGTNISSYAVGDILYASAATTLAKLAAVATGSVLISQGVTTAPVWATPGTANQILRIASGGGAAAFGSINLASVAAVGGTVLAVANGGTGLLSATGGDILYASGANTWARLAQPVANKFLKSTGLTTGATVVWSTLIWPDAIAKGDLLTAAGTTTVARETVGSNGQVLTADSGATNGLRWAGASVYKAADESIVNDTLQSDDELTATLLASSLYAFEFHVHWTTASATAGIQLGVGGTAGVSSLKADVIIYDHAGGGIGAIDRVEAFDAVVSDILTGDNSAVIRGSIETTTTGTLVLRWAQAVTDAGDATIVEENSHLIVRKLA